MTTTNARLEALAMVRAVECCDPGAAQVIYDGSEDKPALVGALAEFARHCLCGWVRDEAKVLTALDAIVADQVSGSDGW